MSRQSLKAPEPPMQIDPFQMRQVMGSFASGVVIVTAVDDGVPVGFTCQSFTSLSLDPPLVSFAPAKSSRTWPKIREIGTFAINILSDHHGELSGRFARSGTDKYAGIEWTPAPSTGAPLFDGVSAWVECSLFQEHDAGDHTIVVAHVIDLGDDAHRDPLLFHRGRYAGLSPL